MATSSGSNFCHCCGSSLERDFKFCPHCGEATVLATVASNSSNVREHSRTTSTVSTASTSTISTSASNTNIAKFSKESRPLHSVKSLDEFKRGKEKERSAYFVRKKGAKRAKVNESEVTITIGVMKDINTIKRGESIPLKVLPSLPSEAILKAAIEKHATFNKRFNPRLNYTLVFKDGSEVATTPGTSPAEPFTLGRYKEVSGFGYSRITLYLVPVLNKKLSDLKQLLVCDSDTDSQSQSDDNLPSVLTVEEDSKDTPGPSGLISCAPPAIHPSSSDMEPCASEVMKVECPLCFLSFPITEVEHHADGCSASFGLIEDCDNGSLNADGSDHEISTTETDSSVIVTLNSCINTLKENSLKSDADSIRVTVRRKMVWEDFKRARNRYYQPERLLKITFSGEPAVDDGGPKREFFAGIS